MSNKNQLPEPLQKALDEFFFATYRDSDAEDRLDLIIQDALNHIDDSGGSAGSTFFFARNLKSLFSVLKQYSKTNKINNHE